MQFAFVCGHIKKHTSKIIGGIEVPHCLAFPQNTNTNNYASTYYANFLAFIQPYNQGISSPVQQLSKRLSLPLNLLGAIYEGAVHNDSFVVFTVIIPSLGMMHTSLAYLEKKTLSRNPCNSKGKDF